MRAAAQAGAATDGRSDLSNEHTNVVEMQSDTRVVPTAPSFAAFSARDVVDEMTLHRL
jgi:hypothetical protein